MIKSVVLQSHTYVIPPVSWASGKYGEGE